MSNPSPTGGKPRVLITGASGKVAQKVIPLLTDRFDLQFTDVMERPGSPQPLRLADLRQCGQTFEVVQGVDAILHMAIASVRDIAGKDVGGRHLTPEQWDAYNDAMLDVNTRSAYHIFEAARRAGVKKVVFFSSILTMLGQPRYASIGAATPPHPANLYACTKLFGEHLGDMYSRHYGISTICLRMGQPYPGIYPWEEECLKTPKARATLVAVEDVAQAIECAVRTQVPFGVYYVLSQSSAPLFDLSASGEIGYLPRVFFTDDGRVVSIDAAPGQSVENMREQQRPKPEGVQ